MSLVGRRVLVAAVIGGLLSACSSMSANDAASRQTHRLLGLLAPQAAPVAASATSTCITDDDTARSLRPEGALPPPGRMPTGSTMARILTRGYLIAGVDQNTLGFGYRTPNGDIEGFDIEMLREIAAAIFGSRDAIRFRAVTSAQRIPAVENNEVDIVASVMSITCDRWKRVDFTTEYYAARQGVLVRATSPIQHVRDLNGRTVCATRGSTSIDQIRRFAPRAHLDAVDLRTECLVHLQEGRADAISTDDTILYGLASQDRLNTQLLTDDLQQPERYGMAINRADPDFVRFVNGVLETIRADGRWSRFHRQLEQQLGIPPASPPPAQYLSNS